MEEEQNNRPLDMSYVTLTQIQLNELDCENAQMEAENENVRRYLEKLQENFEKIQDHWGQMRSDAFRAQQK